MNFHLNRLGKTEYPVSLESLKARREARELNGTELVWREGMTEWQTLDSIFASHQVALDPRLNKKRRAWLPWAIAALILVLAGMSFLGYWGYRALRQIRAITSQAAQNASQVTATEPIPVMTNTLTQADVTKRSRDFRVRQYLESYEKHARAEAAWKAEGTQFLKDWIAEMFEESKATDLKGLRQTARALINTRHCDDPVVLTVASIVSPEEHEKMNFLERALNQYEGSSYPAYPRLYATLALANSLEDTNRIQVLHRSAMDLFEKGFKDGSFRTEDEPELARLFVRDWGASFFRGHGAELVARSPRTSEWRWLTKVLIGAQEIDAAWAARGGGYASTVTTAGWKDFSVHLAKARVAFTDAWQAHPDRPLAASEMITVAMGGANGYEMRMWFDRAVQAQIDDPDAWYKLRWGLRPRWHGSHEELLALGIAAINTGRFDTDVPRKFFDCVADVESEMKLGRGQHIYGREDVWPQFQKMYQGYCDKTPPGELRDGWRSAYAVVAFIAGHPEVAREQLEKLDWKPRAVNLTGWDFDLSLLPLQVAALTGPAAADVKKAENSYQHHDLDLARPRYVALSQSTNADARTIELAQRRLAMMGEEARLAKGEWVNYLPVSTNDPNWTVTDGRIARAGEAAVEIESGDEGHRLYSHTRIGPAFEVQGEFDVVSSSTGDFQAGLVMGMPDNYYSAWHSFRMKTNAVEKAVTTVSKHFEKKQTAAPAALNAVSNTFHFSTRQGHVTASVNGVVVFPESTNRATALNTNAVLGLGAYNDANATVIRYRNVRARRLLGPPGAEE